MKTAAASMQFALVIPSILVEATASCGFDNLGSTGIFSSSFQAPKAPTVSTELVSSFIQHKYDMDVSHVTSGYWYNSAAVGLVRVDEANDQGLGSSLFNYTDVDAHGSIKNRLWMIQGGVGSQPTCFSDYVAAPGFPLLTSDFLVNFNATYGGSVFDPWVGQATSWNLIYPGDIPVIAYLKNESVLAGYDFWGMERRTKVITRFFNIRIGNISSQVFDRFPC